MTEHKMQNPKITAIVCVYNREDTLPQCMDALSRQSLPEADYEVIVVNNNSSDRSPEIAAEFARKFANIQVVHEEKQGLAAARNCGIRAARSTIAAFTDDDAIPADDWLERLLARFNELGDQFVAVGGELEPVWDGEQPDWLTGNFLLHPLSVSLGWSQYARELTDSEWLVEANSAYRIDLVLKYGGFPEHLGRIGNNLLSGENAVNSLFLRDGYRFFFDPEIRVQHQISKSRMTKDWFRRRFFWQGVTTFLVNKYLQSQRCNVSPFMDVMLPMDELSWGYVLGVEDSENFNASLHKLYGIGYALAANQVIVGR